MIKKRLIFLILVFFCLQTVAQDLLQGYVSKDRNVDNCGVFGVIGNLYYTVSRDSRAKDPIYAIHSHSCETMEMKDVRVINTDGISLEGKSWSIEKLDGQLVFILYVWARGTPNHIYAKVIVDSNNVIKADAPLTLVKKWENPIYQGKPHTMGTEVFILGPKVNGPLNKALVYFKRDQEFSGDDPYMKTDLLNFVIIDKDLNVFDSQVTEFENENIPLGEPLLDAVGNFYILPKSQILGSHNGLMSLYNIDGMNNGYVFCYEAMSKSFKKKKPNYTSVFKNGENIISIEDAVVKSNGTLLFTGFYINGPADPYANSADGLFAVEMNLNSPPKVFSLPFKKILDKVHVTENKKITGFNSFAQAFVADDIIVVEKRTVGVDKKGVLVETVAVDYALFTKNSSGNYSHLKNYSTNRGVFVPTRPLRLRTREVAPVLPIFLRDGNKLQMICHNAKGGYEFNKIVMLNSFDLEGELINMDLFKPDPATFKGIAKGATKVTEHSWLIWDNTARAFPVKITFK